MCMQLDARPAQDDQVASWLPMYHPYMHMHMPCVCMQVMLAQPRTTKWLIHGYETCGFSKVKRPAACHLPPTADY